MRAFTTTAAVAGYFLSLCMAQDITAAPTTTSSGPAQTHIISVGIDHKFKPEVTQADVGDIIDFRFFPPNHSVVRAEYEFPCIPYEMTGRGKLGFFSGFYPVDAILEEPPSWSVQINDTDPIFVYCSAPGSCITYGMVAVINPNANSSLERQRQLAKDSAYMLQPGDSFPAEGTPSALATSISSSSIMTSTSTSSLASPTAATSGSHTALSKGAIVGIAVAAAAIVALAAALFFFIGRSRTLRKEVDRGNTTVPSPPSMYQHHSFLAPKSDITDQSSRNSAVNQNANAHYDPYVGVAAGMAGGIHSPDNPKAGHYTHTQGDATGPGTGYSRDTTRSPASDGVEFSSARYTGARSSVPQRYPSLAINPHDPREMSTTN